jgi:hypothetical protein
MNSYPGICLDMCFMKNSTINFSGVPLISLGTTLFPWLVYPRIDLVHVSVYCVLIFLQAI